MSCPNCSNIPPDKLNEYKNVQWMFCGYSCITHYSKLHGGTVRVQPLPVTPADKIKSERDKNK
jgi:hypothetical protein